MKKAVPLLLIFLLLITPTISFAQTTSDPAAVERSMTGLWRGIGKFFGAIGKFFSGKKGGDVLDAVGNAMEESADKAYGGKYAPQKDDENANEEKPNAAPVPTVVKTGEWPIKFINRSDFDISVNISGFTSRLLPVSTDRSYSPEASQVTDRWNNDVFRSALDYNLEYDTHKVRYVLRDNGRTIYFLNRDEENSEYAEETEDTIPADTCATTEDDRENQPLETHANVPTPHFNQNISEPIITTPDAKTAVKKPQADYTEPISHGDPVRKANIAPQQPRRPVPLISDFRKGMYYVQIGSYANVNTVYTEIAKIDHSLPVAVMRATVKINGIDKKVHRILIGPLDYEKSLLLLQQFRVNYHDAFVWQGK